MKFSPTNYHAHRSMWPTSSGLSVLTGIEAELLHVLIDLMVDQIELAFDLNSSHFTGVFLFDSLQPTQQMGVLHQVAFALLNEDVPEPELTAINEATVYALFRELYGRIEIEIDGQRLASDEEKTKPDYDPFAFRAMTLAAWELGSPDGEIGDYEDKDYIPKLECTDLSAWEPIVENLADRILWDRDFEMEYLMADADPVQSKNLKSILGIGRGYYAAVAPDVNEQNFATIRERIRDLVRNGSSPPF